MEVDDMKSNLDIFNIKEWLLTNGLGGYSYMSLPLINTSCYQSLMCVALHTPVDRYSVLENVNEEVIIDNNTYLLNEHIVSVDVEDIVTYTFQIKNISIKKEIAYETNPFSSGSRHGKPLRRFETARWSGSQW